MYGFAPNFLSLFALQGECDGYWRTLEIAARVCMSTLDCVYIVALQLHAKHDVHFLALGSFRGCFFVARSEWFAPSGWCVSFATIYNVRFFARLDHSVETRIALFSSRGVSHTNRTLHFLARTRSPPTHAKCAV
jgi:hypothetical protein